MFHVALFVMLQWIHNGMPGCLATDLQLTRRAVHLERALPKHHTLPNPSRQPTKDLFQFYYHRNYVMIILYPIKLLRRDRKCDILD